MKPLDARIGARHADLAVEGERVHLERISRREFAARTAMGAAAASLSLTRANAASAITAQAVVDRIETHVGVPSRPAALGGFSTGDPATVVTGIATTALPTMNVLRRAVAGGANLIVTSGPASYSRTDAAAPPAGRRAVTGGDAILTAKADFIRQTRLVVWRCSDHWRLRSPDPFARGLADALGWPAVSSGTDPARVSIPGITLGALAALVKQRLNAAGGIRVVGDPRMTVRDVGLLAGATAIQASLGLLPLVDVILAGEMREWESVEYARDAAAAGQQKGLVLLGRVLSEEPGMKLSAEWLNAIVPEVPATWIPAGDPYWRPQ